MRANEIGAAFADHDRGRIGVAADQLGHDRRIGDPQTVGAALNPEWQILAGHLAFLAVLLVRPRGLFPRAND